MSNTQESQPSAAEPAVSGGTSHTFSPQRSMSSDSTSTTDDEAPIVALIPLPKSEPSDSDHSDSDHSKPACASANGCSLRECDPDGTGSQHSKPDHADSDHPSSERRNSENASSGSGSSVYPNSDHADSAYSSSEHSSAEHLHSDGPISKSNSKATIVAPNPNHSSSLSYSDHHSNSDQSEFSSGSTLLAVPEPAAPIYPAGAYDYSANAVDSGIELVRFRSVARGRQPYPRAYRAMHYGMSASEFDGRQESPAEDSLRGARERRRPIKKMTMREMRDETPKMLKRCYIGLLKCCCGFENGRCMGGIY